MTAPHTQSQGGIESDRPVIDREAIARAVLLAMQAKVGSDTYGVSHALKINSERAEKAADAILSLLPHSHSDAQNAGEPVAWLWKPLGGRWWQYVESDADIPDASGTLQPLYASPPAARVDVSRDGQHMMWCAALQSGSADPRAAELIENLQTGKITLGHFADNKEREEAKALIIDALRAYARSYAPTGYVLVPREPTEEMLSAGDSMMPQIAAGQDITTGYDALKDAWPAMLAAALPSTNLGCDK